MWRGLENSISSPLELHIQADECSLARIFVSHRRKKRAAICHVCPSVSHHPLRPSKYSTDHWYTERIGVVLILIPKGPSNWYRPRTVWFIFRLGFYFLLFTIEIGVYPFDHCPRKSHSLYNSQQSAKIVSNGFKKSNRRRIVNLRLSTLYLMFSVSRSNAVCVLLSFLLLACIELSIFFSSRYSWICS